MRWNGEAVAEPATFFVPPRSAYTPQAPRLFSASLGYNPRLGLDADEDDGRVVATGTLPDLLQSSAALRHIWHGSAEEARDGS